MTSLTNLLKHAAQALHNTNEPVIFSGRSLSLYERVDFAALEFDRILPTAQIFFQTSGSTGQAVQIEKNFQQLYAEATMLQGLFPETQSNEWFSLVPPFHVYGFLFSVLVPTLLRKKVCFSLGTEGVFSAREACYNQSVVIAVPAQWNMLKQTVLSQKPKMIFFSGGVFGAERENEVRLLIQHHNLSTRFVEVFGSTETGGIGYREIGIDELGCFKLFPDVTLEACDGHTVVTSPFTNHMPIEIADCLHRNGTSFTHHGRSDRIFKISSLRVSAIQLEQRLSSVFNGARVICHFAHDTSHPKGGLLQAFVEGRPVLLDTIRKSWQNENPELPFPNEIRFIEQFPTNTMGKTTISLLQSV